MLGHPAWTATGPRLCVFALMVCCTAVLARLDGTRYSLSPMFSLFAPPVLDVSLWQAVRAHSPGAGNGDRPDGLPVLSPAPRLQRDDHKREREVA